MVNISKKLLRLPEVKATTGLSKSSIYARIAEGTFPKRIQLGQRFVVWVEADIQTWLMSKYLLRGVNHPSFFMLQQQYQ